jgi:hypothetical protein
LKLSRETIERCQKTEYVLVSSLQRDPVLADRIKRLRTVPGVGPIAALTWALLREQPSQRNLNLEMPGEFCARENV